MAASLRNRVDPRVKDVLILLGVGTFLLASMIMPGLPMAIKPFLDEKRKREENEWKKFNTWRLRQVLRRMHEQKLVEVIEENGMQIVKISEKGNKKLLKYDLETLELKNKKWDGKWRIIIYDIFSQKREERELFRKTLKRLKFLQLQRSVYLIPFKCYDEIEYLRQVCRVDTEVLILTVSGLENEKVYREYFGLL